MAVLRYRSGSSIGLVDFFEKLCDFVTGSDGAQWTLLYTSSSSDKFFHSSGSDSRLNGFIRLSTHLSGVIDNRSNYHNLYSNVFIRGYQDFDNDTLTGKTEYGQRGPMLIRFAQGASSLIENSGIIAHSLRAFYEDNVRYQPSSGNWYLLGRDRPDAIYSTWDKHKYLISYTNDDLGFKDIFKFARFNFTNSGTIGSIVCAEPVFDNNNGNIILYTHNAGVNTSSHAKRFDLRNKKFDGLNSHPAWPNFASTAGAGPQTGIGWDGNDSLLYFSTTYACTYSLATETFKSLSNHGISSQNTVALNKIFYNGSKFFIRAEVNQVFQTYEPDIDTWEKDRYIVNYVTAFKCCTAYDDNKFVFISDSGLATSANIGAGIAVYDLQSDLVNEYDPAKSIPTEQIIRTQDDTFFNVVDVPILFYRNFPKVRVNSTGSTNYWFLGNKDNVIIVTQPYDSESGCFVSSFGKFQTIENRDPMIVLTTVVGSGSAWISVNNASAYSPGETLKVFDLKSPYAKNSLITIIEKTDNAIRANLGFSINAGAVISDVPHRMSIYDGDDEFLSTNERYVSGSCFDGLYTIEPMRINTASNQNFTSTDSSFNNKIYPLIGFDNVKCVDKLIMNDSIFVSNVFSLVNEKKTGGTKSPFREIDQDFNYLILDNKKFLRFKRFTQQLMFSNSSGISFNDDVILYDYIVGPFEEI